MTKSQIIYDNTRNKVYYIIPHVGHQKIITLQKINGSLMPIFIKLIPNNVNAKCYIMYNYMNYPTSANTDGITNELFASPQTIINERARRQLRLY